MSDSIIKVNSLTGIKNAILKYKKVWLRTDSVNAGFVYAEWDGEKVWVNLGMTAYSMPLKEAITKIDGFFYQRGR